MARWLSQSHWRHVQFFSLTAAMSENPIAIVLRTSSDVIDLLKRSDLSRSAFFNVLLCFPLGMYFVNDFNAITLTLVGLPCALFTTFFFRFSFPTTKSAVGSNVGVLIRLLPVEAEDEEGKSLLRDSASTPVGFNRRPAIFTALAVTADAPY